MIHAATLALYVVALALWLRAFVGEGELARRAAVAGWWAAAGVAVHLVALVQFSLEYDQLPLTGLAPSLSTLSFLTGVGLLSTLAFGEASRVGVLLVPLMFVLEATALALGVEPVAGTLDFQGAWFALHVTLALASLGALAMAAASGALYRFQFRELKSRRLGRAFRFLPPLTTLDRLGRVGTVAAFVMLSLALALGWAWTVTFRNSFQAGDPKTVWAVLVWLFTAGALGMRTGSESERRGALGSVLAFVLTVVSYLVVRVVVGGGLFL